MEVLRHHPRTACLPRRARRSSLNPWPVGPMKHATVLAQGKIRCSPFSPCSRDIPLRVAPGGSAPPSPSAPLFAATCMISGRDGKAAPQPNWKVTGRDYTLTFWDRLQKGAFLNGLRAEP
jgi:hypothetical protein